MLSLGFWALGLRALGNRHEASGLPGSRGRGFSLLLPWIREGVGSEGVQGLRSSKRRSYGNGRDSTPEHEDLQGIIIVNFAAPSEQESCPSVLSQDPKPMLNPIRNLQPRRPIKHRLNFIFRISPSSLEPQRCQKSATGQSGAGEAQGAFALRRFRVW